MNRNSDMDFVDDLDFDLDYECQGQMTILRSESGYNIKTVQVRHIVIIVTMVH